jgi:SAM-dependent methyltransferase
LRAASDRAIRFVFDTVADDYAAARPDMPLEAIESALRARGIRRGGRVLEIGAGAGQLTVALVASGFDVLALEPGAAFRSYLHERLPDLDVRPEAFEAFSPHERFDLVAAANAFHWLDPTTAYAKVAEILRPGGALLLVWNTPFLADPDLHRRLQDEILGPRGSSFPSDREGIDARVAGDAAAGRAELSASGRFEQPWWQVMERRLSYPADRYARLIASFGAIAAQPEPERVELQRELKRLLGDGSRELEVVDLVYVVCARVRA